MNARLTSAAAILGSALFWSVLLLAGPGAADAADIRVLAANGVQPIVEDIAPKFERATGNRVIAVFDTGGGTIRRAGAGEAADVVIAPRPGVDELVRGGKVTPGSVADIASTGISVAVRKGAPRPDISTPEALKRTLLAAKTITYLNPADGGVSGVHFASVLERLGIAADMKPKTLLAPKPATVGALVAGGEAEIGVLQYQLLYTVPGIEIVGPLPGDLQLSTVFAALVLQASAQPAAARAFVEFLRTTDAAAVVRAKGMDPVRP